MTEKPLVSIGIPFYNDGEYLRNAIRSVFNQTYRHWELFLISDGGSFDYSSILDEYRGDYKVTIIDDGENRKLPARLNQLSQLANGKYYARMDADDIMHPERIERQVLYLESHPDVDVLGTSAYIIDEGNNIIGGTALSEKPIISSADVLRGHTMMHPSVIGRASWFKLHPYDESCIRMEDMALWCTSASETTFAVMPERLIFYRAIGVPTLGRYLSTQRNYRSYIAREGEKYLSSWQCRILRVKSVLKGVVFTMCYVLGLRKRLILRRYIQLSDMEIKSANEQLKNSI